MGFKPTIAKSIVSVVGGIIIGFLSMELHLFGRGLPGECVPDPSSSIPGAEICVDYVPSLLSFLGPLITLIISIVLIYVIWSLAVKE